MKVYFRPGLSRIKMLYFFEYTLVTSITAVECVQILILLFLLLHSCQQIIHASMIVENLEKCSKIFCLIHSPFQKRANTHVLGTPRTKCRFLTLTQIVCRLGGCALPYL